MIYTHKKKHSVKYTAAAYKVFYSAIEKNLSTKSYFDVNIFGYSITLVHMNRLQKENMFRYSLGG